MLIQVIKQIKNFWQRQRNTQLAQEGFWSLVLRVAYVAIAFITTIILARSLGAENYGIYAYAYALAMLLVIPIYTGLPNLVLRETAKGLAQDQPGLVKGAWWWAGGASIIFSLLIFSIVGPILVAWQGGLTSPTGQAMAYALLLAPILALGNIVGAALRGMRYIVIGQLSEFIIRPLLFLAFIIFFIYVYHERFSASKALVLYIFAASIAFAIGMRMLLRRTPTSVRSASPIVKSHKWLVSAALFALIAGFGAINDQASTVILGYYKTPDQVGLYRVAIQVARLASFGLQVANMVAAPRFAKLYALGEVGRIQKLATSIARVSLFSNLLFTIFFILLGKTFFNVVFGFEFSASYWPLLILLIGQLVNSAVGSVGYLLNMTGHEKETVWGMAAAAGLNILLGLVLVPPFGIMGAAASVALSMVFWNIYLWWRVCKIIRVNSFILNRVNGC